MSATNWSFTDAITINCSFDIFPFHIVGVIYRCDGNVTFDGTTDDRITAVYGTHLHDLRNNDIQGLIIRSQNMESFPVNIGSFFPDMRVINFPLNSISSVTNKHLQPFPNLEFLALFGNRITSLDSDLFAGLRSLKFVNFGRNRIKHVGHDFILPPTAHIYLYSNLCVDMDAVTALEVTYLRFSLTMNCPPANTLQISSAVDNHPNQIRDDRKKFLKNKFLQLAMRVSFPEAFIDNTRCLNVEDPSVHV